MKSVCVVGVVGLLIGAVPGVASGQVVYNTGPATGFFTPFDSNTPAGTLYGDSGWFGSGGDAPAAVTSLTLGLAVFGALATAEGTADLVFTFNDGDPSGLVFGSGATLYSTTLSNVTLPATVAGLATYFEVEVPLPSVMTAGGFNNFGFSLGVENFNYDGSFGFQNRGAFNNLGFYTNNASQFTPGSGGSVFAFGPNDPGDIANFVMTLEVPAPGGLAVLGLGAIAAVRRRR